MIEGSLAAMPEGDAKAAGTRDMETRSGTVEGISVRRIDIPMRWLERGEGLPLVLIHGMPTSPLLWREVIVRIAGARCLAWEMVGYGASILEGRERDISVSAQADYLVLWLNYLGISRAVLAGHCVGAVVAQVAAIRYPGMCAGLFLTNVSGYDSWPPAFVRRLQALNGAVQRLPNPLFKPLFRAWVRRGHDSSAQAQAALEAHWPHYARNGGAAAFVRQIDALDVRDTLAVADRLPDLNLPARLVWGTGDRSQTIELGERLARALNAPLRRIEGAKHFTPEDHPEVVAEEINRLLEEVRNARRRPLISR
jgi:pimeloyl-ACP methyl ester carboxylesterase